MARGNFFPHSVLSLFCAKVDLAAVFSTSKRDLGLGVTESDPLTGSPSIMHSAAASATTRVFHG